MVDALGGGQSALALAFAAQRMLVTERGARLGPALGVASVGRAPSTPVVLSTVLFTSPTLDELAAAGFGALLKSGHGYPARLIRDRL